MVLEPLSAVSLAAGVVQFIGYGYKILSKGNQLYKAADGVLSESALLELAIKDLKELLKRIKQASSPKSPVWQGFQDKSVKLVDEKLDCLEKLKVYGSPGKWKSLRKALKSVHCKEQIDKWIEQLNMLRDEFNVHIEVDIL